MPSMPCAILTAPCSWATALSCNSPSSRRVVSAILSVDRAMDTRREAGAMDRRVHRRVVDRVAASTA